MPRTSKTHAVIQKELGRVLAPVLPGIEIQVDHSDRWDRMCLTFRWAGFAGLLPEERFRRLAFHIAGEFRERRIQGAVWVELAPEETLEDYLKLPRSDDIADRERSIAHGLLEVGFFDALEQHLGPLPMEETLVDFSCSRAVLRGKGMSAGAIQEACLLFLRHGAYCDCEVLLRARPAILALEVKP